MKVAHVTATFPPYWGGTGNVAYHNARLLHQRGHEVTVFTAAKKAGVRPDFPFAVEYLPVTLAIGNAPLTPRLLGRLGQFDLIHLHYPYIFGAELVALAAMRFKVPMVLTYHNRLEDDARLKGMLLRAYNRTFQPLTLRLSRRIFAVRRGHFESVQPALSAAAKVRELHNGVDIGLFSRRPDNGVRARFGLDPHVPVALFVGALDSAHRFKNLEGLLRVLAAGPPSPHLIVVGGGDRRPEFETIVDNLRLSDRVHFAGRPATEELPDYYSAADVTVLPSSALESFGLVLLESMACGTPVIATALPGVKDLVEDGYDGRLIPPGDEAALTAALTDVLEDRERARVMGERASIKVRAEYDWEIIGARLEGFYREVVGV